MALFGLAGGVGMAPLPDTVIAAVPVDDARVGSAMNDVSRELGAALGIAAVGSPVSSLYQREVSSTLGATVPHALVESLSDGVGVASVVAQSLPPELQITVLAVSQAAYVDAFTTEFVLKAVLLAVTTLVAAVLVPRQARTHQAMEAVVERVSLLSEDASLEESQVA